MNNKSFRDNAPTWAFLALAVIYLAVLGAGAYEDGMNLLEFMGAFPAAMNAPLELRWTEHTVKFIFIFLFLYALCICLYYSSIQNRRPGEEHGSAKWGSVRELNRKYSDREPDKNVILTQNLSMSLNPRQHMRNLLQIVVGGSGSGKTRFVVKPNLLCVNASYIVTDPKGELVRTATPLLLQNGYVVKVFDLIEPSHSDSYNPFRYIRKDSDVFKLSCRVQDAAQAVWDILRADGKGSWSLQSGNYYSDDYRSSYILSMEDSFGHYARIVISPLQQSRGSCPVAYDIAVFDAMSEIKNPVICESMRNGLIAVLHAGGINISHQGGLLQQPIQAQDEFCNTIALRCNQQRNLWLSAIQRDNKTLR